MIRVTAFSGEGFVLNADQIEKVEDVPECIITLVNGKKYMIKETSEEVIEKVIEYKKSILSFGLK